MLFSGCKHSFVELHSLRRTSRYGKSCAAPDMLRDVVDLLLQFRPRVVQSVHPPAGLKLCSDALLLDMVPPSPYHASAADVLHTRSRSSEPARDNAATDRDWLRLTAAVANSTTAAAPTLPARRPLTPQLPASASNSLLTGDVYHNGARPSPDHVWINSANSKHISRPPGDAPYHVLTFLVPTLYSFRCKLCASCIYFMCDVV